MALSRESARQQRLAAAAALRREREMARQRKTAQREAEQVARQSLLFETRAMRQAEKNQKAAQLEARQQETADLNASVSETLDNLAGVLSHTLLKDDTIDFESLRAREVPPSLRFPAQLLNATPEPAESDFASHLVEPTGVKALWPGAKAKYEADLTEARNAYLDAAEEWRQTELRRLQQLTDAELAHQIELQEFERKQHSRNSDVDEFEDAYLAGSPDAIVAYNSMILERSLYPDGFPQKFSLAYTEASKQLVIEYELPSPDIIPKTAEYKYVRSSESIIEKPRKPAEVRALYQDVVASVALRTMHEVVEGDQGSHIAVVCFNGYIHSIDAATGKDTQPHLISVRATKDRMLEINLARVDKATCLRNLGAQVSRQPEEATPIKPIIEFEMADARFVDQSDLVSGLSSATNLMDLNPFEFEQLVANAFGLMGLESKLTRSSRDGGVDCIAFDRRPVLGGKVVIQAKRYKNTVGVSAVRDLYGTMMNEGANKGILVTTSGYGPDAFDFARSKPIELIDGSGFLFLLQEVGVSARIIFPED